MNRKPEEGQGRKDGAVTSLQTVSSHACLCSGLAPSPLCPPCPVGGADLCAEAQARAVQPRTPVHQRPPPRTGSAALV